MTDAVVFQRYSRGRPRVRGGRGWATFQPTETVWVGPACAGVEGTGCGSPATPGSRPRVRRGRGMTLGRRVIVVESAPRARG